MRTVLFLNPVGTIGGAERVLLSLAQGARLAGWKTAALLGSSGPLGEKLREIDCEARVLALPRSILDAGDSGLKRRNPLSALTGALKLTALLPETALYARKLGQAFREIQPDVIHSHGIKMHFLSGMAASDAKRLWHIHDFIGNRPVMSHALALVTARRPHAIAVSGAVARDFARLFDRVPVSVVANGIDCQSFAPATPPLGFLDSAAGLEPAGPASTRIGLVATYARWKGHELFIQSCARVARKNPEARFYIVGGPIYQTPGSQYNESELRAMAHDAGLDGKLGFVPFQADPRKAYASLDLLVHASREPEPFGLTIVEGLAMGLPVICAKTAGAVELLNDGEDAVLFDSSDPWALARALERLIDDRRLRAHLSNEGRKTALREFDQSRMVHQVLELYGRSE